MKVQVHTIGLDGGGREIALAPGLNIVTGPIASGKTTLIRYLRFLLGHSIGQLPKEARASVTAVSGSVDLNGKAFSIVRPAVTTSTARTDIAGEDQTWRLPATSSPDGNTYVNWLLEQLDLPRIEVPSAPTRADSDPTPVSINDYFMYSYLAQDELGFSVFGHQDHHKNIKRKYVFDITYGFYDLTVAQLQDRFRDVHSRLRELQARQRLFGTFFDNTPLENRARIEHELREVNAELKRVEADSMEVASVSHGVPGTSELRSEVLELERRTAELQATIDAEQTSLQNLKDLTNQLESQSGKLTRSIVSHKHLMDVEFVVCPRCGSDVASERAPEGTCQLCLQPPTLEFSRETLVSEQGAVEQQLTEVQDLVRERVGRATRLRSELTRVEAELTQRRMELEFQTKSYVSERATRIASAAARRARLASRMEQLQEYLAVLSKMDDAQKLAAKLTVERDRLEQDLSTATARSTDARRRVEHLKGRFNEILGRLRPPHFGEDDVSSINATTYLPEYYGRGFTELSSPGLATLVNLAHALAHHLTAIELDLKLPDLLIIDGLSEHLGQEGLDPERRAAAYDVLMDLSESYPQLQVVLVDTEIPSEARTFVRVELSEDDRLIRDGSGEANRAP